MSRELIISVDSNRRVVNYAEFVSFCNQFKTGRTLLIAKDYRKRSLSQLGYYFGVLVPIMKEELQKAGWDEIQDDIDAHEFIKAEFLSTKMINKETGEVKTIPGSTKKLSIEKFNELIEKICKFCAEYFGRVVPAPSKEYAILSDYVENLEMDA